MFIDFTVKGVIQIFKFRLILSSVVYKWSTNHGKTHIFYVLSVRKRSPFNVQYNHFILYSSLLKIQYTLSYKFLIRHPSSRHNILKPLLFLHYQTSLIFENSPLILKLTRTRSLQPLWSTPLPKPISTSTPLPNLLSLLILPPSGYHLFIKNPSRSIPPVSNLRSDFSDLKRSVCLPVEGLY